MILATWLGLIVLLLTYVGSFCFGMSQAYEPRNDSTYRSGYGVMRLSSDPQQINAIKDMHEREMHLETLKETHRHDEVKIMLENELQLAQWEHAREQARIKTQYRLALFRTADLTLIMLVTVCLLFQYYHRKTQKRLDNAFVNGGDVP